MAGARSKPGPDGSARGPFVAGLLSLVAASFLLSGCATTGGSATTWARTLEASGVPVGSVPDPFELAPGMAEVAREMAGSGKPQERLRRLQQALFDPERFTFDYQARETYTAAEAFRLRRGNCVSFTNLFLALGRSLGLELRGALYRRAEAIERDGGFVILRSHIVVVRVDGPQALVFDFYGTPDANPGKLHVLQDAEVAAIYLGNRGVESMMRGDLETAAGELGIAARLGPSLAQAHGNLGVLQLRRGDRAAALASYRRALELEPHNQSVLHNLASFHRGEGREGEARSALAALDDSSANPYTLLVKGDLELLSGDVAGALRTFRRARRAGPSLVEPLTAIARAELSRGHVDSARKALRQALDLSPNDPEADRLLDGLR